MTDSITVALIAAVFGLVTGVIGSLAAPWANWGVERRRVRLASRQARITEWRQAVAAEGYQPDQFRQTTAYTSLRPYLPERLRQAIDAAGSDAITIQADGRYAGLQPSATELLDEIGRIERDWGLV